MSVGPFNLTYLEHAEDRMEQRGISPSEVDEVWGSGKDTTSESLNGMIRIDGATAAGRHLRILRLPDNPVVVSVVEIEEAK